MKISICSESFISATRNVLPASFFPSMTLNTTMVVLANSMVFIIQTIQSFVNFLDKLIIFSFAGNSPFYRIHSIKKESGFGHLFEGNKNDYDWLKTPPATPLFPSLEMEATAPSHKNAQKETPLVQPLSQPQSQASSNSESTKKSSGIEKSPITKAKIPSRSITPSNRPRINSSIDPKNTKRTTNPSPNPNHRIDQTSQIDLTVKRNNNIKPTNLKESYTDYLTSNLLKGSTNSVKPNQNQNPNPRSRPTSPIVRSTIASQIPEFSNETPPNLRTDRSSSVTRGRQPENVEKSEANPRRQSCSPSVTRGRKVEVAKQEKNRGGNLSNNDQRRTETTNILGSRMVERVMNARKAIGNEERDVKPSRRRGIGEFRQTIRQK
ncbi:serine/arginine repetitive matrix protein 1 isoform X2 [Cucumis sativus]|uniref:serine/arginine repetitive matrix protein 1 isoform X2 n=1 Tax=Cucumis sativus TaxID=3659 RepID=UPI0012F522BD|nr:serine/arginine repetitive matrix protein 1 isoform X2 [Cucumis sativus]